MLSPVCDGSKPSSVASKQMVLPVASETDQESASAVLEQILLPVLPETEQEPSPTASE